MTNPSHPLKRRVGVLAIHSVDRFIFTVPDLREAERFYRAFGLDVCREEGRVDLRTFGNSQLWASLHEAPGPKRLQYLRLGIDAQDHDAFAEKIRSCGLAAAPHRLSDGAGLWLTSPDGTALQLVVADKVSPSTRSPRLPLPDTRPGTGAAPPRSRRLGVQPRTLSHLLLFTPDVPRMIDFCQQVLGLRLSDRSGDLIAFLHGAHGSDHHLLAFASSHAAGLHHSSWDVGSLDEVGAGAEQMRDAGYDRGWGLGRHVLGSNYFHYVRDPWGSFAEYSFDIDFVPHDVDWPAADHPPEDSLYVWGPAVPEDFVTNHEQTEDSNSESDAVQGDPA
ncbi:VOC family protein [Pelomonas sp. KK5]|uniref:VOC family protein n=1 Tax=Pelomonas sp. KK5 TaxID=1855730 RepID=UPI00097C26E0|nr:VOC family protein [Pelomonas sp. KK5]